MKKLRVYLDETSFTRGVRVLKYRVRGEQTAADIEVTVEAALRRATSAHELMASPAQVRWAVLHHAEILAEETARGMGVK